MDCGDTHALRGVQTVIATGAGHMTPMFIC
jgi:hypothetical protein